MRSKKEKRKIKNKTKKISLIKSSRDIKKITRPVIAVLSVPAPENKQSHSHSYLPSSCIKWVEKGGARVVPIQYGLPINVIIAILQQCNGFITWGSQFVAGGLPNKNDRRFLKHKISLHNFKTFVRALDAIFLYISKQNLEGNYYPMLGIGDGMQYLAITAIFAYKRYKSKITRSLLLNNNSIVEATELPSSLSFTSNKSIIKSLFTPKERKSMSQKKVVYMDNFLGFVPGCPYMDIFKDTTKTAPTEMEVIATSKGRTGKKYISIYSFRHLPLYGYSFQPQYTAFEWKIPNIPYSTLAFDVSRKLSEFFVNECKKNLNKLIDKDLLIYNYTLYGIPKLQKILNPTNWDYTFLINKFESNYYFNIVQY